MAAIIILIWANLDLSAYWKSDKPTGSRFTITARRNLILQGKPQAQALKLIPPCEQDILHYSDLLVFLRGSQELKHTIK